MTVTIFAGAFGEWTMDLPQGGKLLGCRLEPDLYEVRAVHKDGTLGPCFQAATPLRAEKLARIYLDGHHAG